MSATCLAVVLCGALLAGSGPAHGEGRGASRTAPLAADSRPIAIDARIAGDDSETRFVMDLSRKTEVYAFTLADPYRAVIDLPHVNFRLPSKAGERGHGLITSFRYGLVMQGGSRIVLDTTKPVRIEKVFVLDAVDGLPARLVLDLAAVDRETFMRMIALEGRAGKSRGLARRSEIEPPNRNENDPRPVIVLDPGHGGIDTGTRAGSNVDEKTVVLEFARMLRDKIERAGKYRVVLTRTEDVFVPLAERVRIARAHRAQLFISIHCDALVRGEGEAQGATVYTLSETASDAEAARLAEAENKADVIAGIDLSAEPGDVTDILIDLAQRETKLFSIHFARALVGELKLSARLHKQPMKSAGFRVLMAPDVPSVLIELGYVSSQHDLKQLTSGAWRSRAGDSIVHAIDAFFTTRLAGASPAGGRN